jgi:Zn-dependent M28 family amino/carboxypeptidase
LKKASLASTPPNVVATLMGSDPTLRNEYVVFSAHMDHVGLGAPDASGDSIFNGADDDASGTATMLEVAEAFASLPQRPARSMIFLAVSGEEKGLLGSAFFTENPPVPIERMVANINLDMVGRNNPDSIIGIGNEYSSLGTLVQEVATAHSELGLVVGPDPLPEERLFFRSDHFNFAKAGVPAIFFTTGLHDQYHKQSDEVELIDTDKISRVGRLVFHLALEIATLPTAPTWTEKGITEVQPANVSGR